MNRRTLGHVLQLVGVGWYIGFSILGGVAGGLWLDRRVGTDSLFTVLGLVLGLVVAFYGVYRMLQPLLRNGGKGS